jgi:hypothetical protein
MRLDGQVNVTAVDTAPYVTALPGLLAELRRLTFADGVVEHPITGERHEGLRLIEGTHPYPGAVYRLVIREENPPRPPDEETVVARRFDAADPRAAADREGGRVAAARTAGRMDVRWHALLVTLASDDARRTTLRVRDEPGEVEARVDLHPTSMVDVIVDLADLAPGSVLLRGGIQVLLRLDAARLPPYGTGSPQLVTTVRHPRGRVHGDVWFAAEPAGHWMVVARVAARGAGWWARPLVCLATPLLRRPARRGLDEVLGGLPAAFEQLAAFLAAHPADPAKLVADAVSALPHTLPGPGRSGVRT